MRTFLDIQQITISRARKPDKTGRYRWTVLWITSATTVTQSFFSQKAALEAVVAHKITSPKHRALTPTLVSTLPSAIPSTKAICAWMDVADQLMDAAMNQKGAA